MGIQWAEAGKPVSKPINKHQDAKGYKLHTHNSVRLEPKKENG